MKSEIEKAIGVLASLVTKDLTGPEAQHYTQAICNLAHAYGVLTNAEKSQ